jgi:protease YdgD
LRLAAALVLLVAATASGRAGDRRVAVDPNQPPWNAVAKVQTNTAARCTGVLIAPAIVLTAAHCLYNPRTRAMLQPLSLHVLFGYQRSDYRWHRLVARFTVGAGFDGGIGRPQPSDWARLELAEAVPVTPLPLAGGSATAGMATALAGYNQDRAQLMMADLACQVLRTAPQPGGARFLAHDCEGTRGTSGGPLLARQDGGWAVVGIAIAAGAGSNLALAPALKELLSDRKGLLSDSP